MTVVLLALLKDNCVNEADKQTITDFIDECCSSKNMLFNRMDEVELYYYYTFGSIHPLDRKVLDQAFETNNYKLWYDCHLVYPNNLPEIAHLYLPNTDDSIEVKLTPLSFSLISPDGENG